MNGSFTGYLTKEVQGSDFIPMKGKDSEFTYIYRLDSTVTILSAETSSIEQFRPYIHAHTHLATYTTPPSHHEHTNMGRLTLISECDATIQEIEGFLNLTRFQVSAAATEKTQRFWRDTHDAWESKYKMKALELLELGELNSAMKDYGKDLWVGATKETVDGLSAAYLLARKNRQTQTANTLLGMVQDRRTTASVSSLLAYWHHFPDIRFRPAPWKRRQRLLMFPVCPLRSRRRHLP